MSEILLALILLVQIIGLIFIGYELYLIIDLIEGDKNER